MAWLLPCQSFWALGLLPMEGLRRVGFITKRQRHQNKFCRFRFSRLVLLLLLVRSNDKGFITQTQASECPIAVNRNSARAARIRRQKAQKSNGNQAIGFSAPFSVCSVDPFRCLGHDLERDSAKANNTVLHRLYLISHLT